MKPQLITLSTFILLTACESKAGTGAIAGAGLGALTGGLIAGNATGALIGAGVGAVAGGLIGAALDEQDRKIMQQNSPQTLQRIDNREQLSIYDIEALSKNGIQDDIIIGQIQNTKSVFYLTSEQIIELKQAGVSQRIIEYMIQTGRN
ncbi:MAG: glycine zipper domain-containing protein [Chlamydiota bacterium]